MARPPRSLRVVRTGWLNDLRYGRDGPYTDVENTLVALRAVPGFIDAFAFDEMAQRVKLARDHPIVDEGERGDPPPRFLSDADISRVQSWLQANGISKLAKETVRQAIYLRALAFRFHPVRDMLDGFAEAWDGTPRVGAWLHDYLGTPDDEYHRQVGSMFLIALVKRIYEPGCQSDYMIVLEGPQGEEKSKLCRALVGDEYFSDSMPSISGGDQVRLSMHLRNKWLIELSELAAMSKSDAEPLKAFISRRTEDYTAKFAHEEGHEPRQCSFIGTTNDDSYLKDDTGARRFWPVAVKLILYTAFVEVREQLLGEAVQLYREGKQHWPDRGFEKEVMAPIQAQRQWHDEWTAKVVEAADRMTTVTIAGIWEKMNTNFNGGSDVTKLDMLAQKRIASILRKQGYRKFRETSGRISWRKVEIPNPPEPFEPFPL